MLNYPGVFYKTTADALKAKRHWEENHRILFPDDLKEQQPPKREARPIRRYSRRVEPDLFSEARI